MKKNKRGSAPWKKRVLFVKRIGQDTGRSKVDGDGTRVNR